MNLWLRNSYVMLTNQIQHSLLWRMCINVLVCSLIIVALCLVALYPQLSLIVLSTCLVLTIGAVALLRYQKIKFTRLAVMNNRERTIDRAVSSPQPQAQYVEEDPNQLFRRLTDNSDGNIHLLKPTVCERDLGNTGVRKQNLRDVSTIAKEVTQKPAVQNAGNGHKSMHYCPRFPVRAPFNQPCFHTLDEVIVLFRNLIVEFKGNTNFSKFREEEIQVNSIFDHQDQATLMLPRQVVVDDNCRASVIDFNREQFKQSHSPILNQEIECKIITTLLFILRDTFYYACDREDKYRDLDNIQQVFKSNFQSFSELDLDVYEYRGYVAIPRLSLLQACRNLRDMAQHVIADERYKLFLNVSAKTFTIVQPGQTSGVSETLTYRAQGLSLYAPVPIQYSPSDAQLNDIIRRNLIHIGLAFIDLKDDSCLQKCDEPLHRNTLITIAQILYRVLGVNGVTHEYSHNDLMEIVMALRHHLADGENIDTIVSENGYFVPRLFRRIDPTKRITLEMLSSGQA